MMSDKEEKYSPEEIKQMLGAVSKEVPPLIKGIMESVFSEESGRNMGKAAGALYKELKASGIPDETAIRMTENYIAAFTNISKIMKETTGNIGKHHHDDDDDD